MSEIYRALKIAEPYLYILAGIILFLYFRRFIAALFELKQAIFGLEKDHARNRLFMHGSVILLVLVLAGGVFAFITIGQEKPEVFNIQATPTTDLSSTPTVAGGLSNTADLTEQMTGSMQTTESKCEVGKIEWTSPADGGEIKGKYELKGTASIVNFGFYKYEYSQDNSIWNALAVGNSPVVSDVLGIWDTTLLSPGDYYLRLVVYDNQNNANPPCVVRVNVKAQ